MRLSDTLSRGAASELGDAVRQTRILSASPLQRGERFRRFGRCQVLVMSFRAAKSRG